MKIHTIIYIATLSMMGLICHSEEPVSPKSLTLPHGEWIQVSDGMDVAAGPQDTNTFADSKVVIQLYLRTRDGVLPDITPGGVDFAVPNNATTIPHTSVKLRDKLVWKKTSVAGIYVASAAEATLTPKGKWGVSVLANLHKGGKTKPVATTTCAFTVK